MPVAVADDLCVSQGEGSPLPTSRPNQLDADTWAGHVHTHCPVSAWTAASAPGGEVTEAQRVYI